MRFLIDTNVLISAALNPNGVPFQAYKKWPHILIEALFVSRMLMSLSAYLKKFPAKLTALDKFLSIALVTLELVSVPDDEVSEELLIRDINDRLILRVAINAKADILLTSNKDFLESGIDNPKIMASVEFIELKV